MAKDITCSSALVSCTSHCEDTAPALLHKPTFTDCQDMSKNQVTPKITIIADAKDRHTSKMCMCVTDVCSDTQTPWMQAKVKWELYHKALEE